MNRKKLALTEEIVKYIFSGTEASIAIGEDGYIVYGFKMLYPSELGVFVPIEIDRSNYSDVFPKNFESYFRELDKDFDYLSRLLEVKMDNPFRGCGIEYVSGAMLKRDEGNYTIFRFDELIDSNFKIDLLCRAKIDSITESQRRLIMNSEPFYVSFAPNYDGTKYLYFIIPINRIFGDSDGLTAAVFAFSQSFPKK